MEGYYETIEQNFLLARHSKSQVDSGFGMIKRKYRKSEVYCLDDFVEVVKKSSPAGLNKARCYEDGQGFQYFDFKGTLEKYFVKLPTNIGKCHHFLFKNSNFGMVKVKKLVDSK